MKHSRLELLPTTLAMTILLFAGMPALPSWGASDLDTAFSYQALLALQGVPVNDVCDFEFSVFDSLEGGTPVGPVLTYDGQGDNPGPISVSNGMLVVDLDFGTGVFTGQQRFLELRVRSPSGVGAYTLLVPRQQILPTPYALFAGETGAVSAPLVLSTDDPSNATLTVEHQLLDGTALRALGDVTIGPTSAFHVDAESGDALSEGTVSASGLEASSDASIGRDLVVERNLSVNNELTVASNLHVDPVSRSVFVGGKLMVQVGSGPTAAPDFIVDESGTYAADHFRVGSSIPPSETIFDVNFGLAEFNVPTLRLKTPVYFKAFEVDALGNLFTQGYVEPNSGIRDDNMSLGTTSQILGSSGNGVVWRNQGEIDEGDLLVGPPSERIFTVERGIETVTAKADLKVDSAAGNPIFTVERGIQDVTATADFAVKDAGGDSTFAVDIELDETQIANLLRIVPMGGGSGGGSGTDVLLNGQEKSLSLPGRFYDAGSAPGTAGQILSSTGDGTMWVDCDCGGGGAGCSCTDFTATGNTMLGDDEHDTTTITGDTDLQGGLLVLGDATMGDADSDQMDVAGSLSVGNGLMAAATGGLTASTPNLPVGVYAQAGPGQTTAAAGYFERRGTSSTLFNTSPSAGLIATANNAGGPAALFLKPSSSDAFPALYAQSQGSAAAAVFRSADAGFSGTAYSGSTVRILNSGSSGSALDVQVSGSSSSPALLAASNSSGGLAARFRNSGTGFLDTVSIQGNTSANALSVDHQGTGGRIARFSRSVAGTSGGGVEIDIVGTGNALDVTHRGSGLAANIGMDPPSSNLCMYIKNNHADGRALRVENQQGTGGTGGGLALEVNGPSAFFGSIDTLGSVNVGGTLCATSVCAAVKTFQIDHPLDPENKVLRHASVESSEMLNVYSGNTTTCDNGYATVELPEWFGALNRDFRYQLTVIDEADGDEFVLAKVVRPIKENRFTIRTSEPLATVSWQVTGVRHDAFARANPLSVESAK